MIKNLFFILLILSFSFLIFSQRDFVPQRTWTTAICEETACRDFEVNCVGDEVVSLKPITSFVVFDDGWVDNRESKDLC